MASLNYAEAIKTSQVMTVISPDGREFYGHYCDPKLDRSTLPAGWYAYDIRHDDDGCGVFTELCHRYVMVNSAGTFFTQQPIPELSQDGSSLFFKIDPEEWNLTHCGETEPVGPNPGDWEYTF